ncbi:splicing factor, proline- and glutamine-rich-like [Neocloeon triangulifer]|uniref:splicing factor, proline- and glutamine-rich-like n=1 Tax=Neocloeon triangulifer TaxID=2078957 RepID=UPI00286FADFB|nr:splicing factor, proline- and glutamine-rich-like [Neocloeon triangulifer]XP_059483147.1 splicing factor, proline- and glutamine-rich-like [Neocloeon triangulifer]
MDSIMNATSLLFVTRPVGDPNDDMGSLQIDIMRAACRGNISSRMLFILLDAMHEPFNVQEEKAVLRERAYAAMQTRFQHYIAQFGPLAGPVAGGQPPPPLPAGPPPVAVPFVAPGPPPVADALMAPGPVGPAGDAPAVAAPASP